MKRILYILALTLSIVACSDDIDKSNRYTFTGETVADYLLNRSDKYSHFITLLKRAELFSLLQTYGQYTLFLPDNDAVEKYVAEQDSIYWTTKDTDAPVKTGITSPRVEELSDSMANVIARTHLVEGNYLTATFDDGALPRWNFYDRYLGISCEPTDEGFYIKVNTTAAIIDSDNEVENGVVHIMDRVIEPTNLILPEQIAKYNYFSLFSEALNETRFCDSLLLFIDDNFEPLKTVDAQYTPQKKYYRYTGFVEPDEVFHNNGIYTLADLKAFAEKWYGAEERDNPKHPRNALNRFVTYHFVERELPYNKIIPMQVKDYSLADLITSGHDCFDYMETMLGKLVKVTKPLSSADGAWVYINRPKDGKFYNHEMRKHLNVRLIEPTEFIQSKDEYSQFNPIAMNGVIHPIDKILVYDEDEMAGNILNERMRFDVGTLLPELSCNNIRYSSPSQYIPYYYCKNIVSNTNESDNFRYFLYPWFYMCDAIFQNQNEQFDISLRLPPVPQRTYEIRMGIFIINFEDKRLWPGVMQPYLDGKICSVPIDLTVNNNSLMWVSDADTNDNGVAFDKYLRSIGYMKGADSFKILLRLDGFAPARNENNSFRKIITKAHLSEGEHWIRLRLLSEGLPNPFDIDYIELVPLHIVNDPVVPEDRH